MSNEKEVNIYRDNNHVYFYEEVKDRTILEMIKEIRTATQDLLRAKHEWGMEEPKVVLHIRSNGGYLDAGVAGAEFIQRNEVPVHTIIEGFVASAGTHLSCAGAFRQMTSRSLCLIHQLTTGFWGTADKLKEHTENIETHMEIMRKFYRERTKMNTKEINELLKKDTYLTSDKCLEYGVIDEII